MDRIAVPQQRLGGGVVGGCIDGLLRGPCCRRRIRSIEMNDFPPFALHDDQNKKQTSSHGRNHKEIHGDNASRMVLQKGPPVLRRLAAGTGALLPDGGSRSLQTWFGQFVADARAAPSRVDGPYAADELDQFQILPRSITPSAGLSSPKHPQSRSLPADDGLGPEDHQRGFPIRPSPLEYHPETPVPRATLRPRRLPFKHSDWVSQGGSFHGRFVLRAEQRPRVD